MRLLPPKWLPFGIAGAESMVEGKSSLSPKVMVISNLPATGPLWVMSLQHQLQLQVVLESDPANVINRWAAEIPDLILFDLNLPAAALIELVRRLREETAMPILVLTGQPSEEFHVALYQAGADEIILKPLGASLFHANVNVWLRRSGSVPTDVLNPLRVGNLRLHPAERLFILENGRPVRLTSLELQLLYCLMSQPGRAVSTEALIQRIWGVHAAGDTAALKNLIYRLRQKIEKDPGEPKIIQTAAGVGYRFSTGKD